MTFFFYLAWTFAVLSLLVIGIRIYGFHEYHYSKVAKLMQLVDQINGIKRSFPIVVPGIIFIVSVCYLLSVYFGGSNG